MEILWTIIIGLIVGIIGRMLVPGRDPMGWIATILLGIGGAILGSLIGSLLDDQPGVSISVVNSGAWGWILSIMGAVILILLYRQFRTRGGGIARTA
jgi:uncharacterized membrane protein YeaQ/YmgE (transglycosylase-associated protein family)